jgi:hypothetical protein
MDAPAMFGMTVLGWAPSDMMVPSLVGLGAALLAVVGLHFLSRSRSGQGSEQAPKAAAPEHDPFVQGSATEQRKSHRRGGNPVGVLLRTPGTGLEPRRALVLNRSSGGLRLEVEEMAAVESVLEVRPADAPPVTPWVEVKVKDCRRTSDGWQLGCEFVRTPPWALLLMFG